MRIPIALITVAFAGSAFATLPPPTEEAKAKAVESAAKTAWSDKVAAYQTCVSMERTAEAYRNSLKVEGKNAPAPVTTAPCVDPGAYVSPMTPMASKPLEASGAHSPPGTATSPPSQSKTSAEISRGGKP